jgi:hypothetical protein
MQASKCSSTVTGCSEGEGFKCSFDLLYFHSRMGL